MSHLILTCRLPVSTFSWQNGGSHLCAVDDSNDHVLSVWDWQKEERLADVKVSLKPFIAAKPCPTGHCLHSQQAPGPPRPTLGDSPFLQLSLLLCFFPHEAPLQTHQGISCLPESIDFFSYLFPSENPNFNSFSHCLLTFVLSASLGAQCVLGCLP